MIYNPSSQSPSCLAQICMQWYGLQQPIITAAAMSHDITNARARSSLIYFARDVQTHLTYFCRKHLNSSLFFQVPKVSERLIIPVTYIPVTYIRERGLRSWSNMAPRSIVNKRNCAKLSSSHDVLQFILSIQRLFIIYDVPNFQPI